MRLFRCGCWHGASKLTWSKEIALNETTNSAAEEWLTEHGGVLYRYALLQLRDLHKAEDMVQETLLAARALRGSFACCAKPCQF